MSKKSRIVLIVLIAAVVAGGYFLLRPRPQLPAPETTLAELRLSGYDQAGRISWRVKAETGKIDEDQSGVLHTVSLSIYAQGKPRWTAVAPTLTFAHDHARLTGGVDVTVNGEDKLTTGSVAWNKRTNKLMGTEPVTIVTAHARVTAHGFTYDPGTDRFTLTGGVNAQLDEPSAIAATGDEATYTERGVVLSGAVRITSGNDVYECARAEYSEHERTVDLSGGVTGALAAGKLTAARIEVTADGSTASGDVELLLNSKFFRGNDGA